MSEPTTYLGASSRHVFCEDYKFQPNVALKIFKRNEIFSELTWLDIKNCTGTLDQDTFKNLPNLEILNIINCTFEKINENGFSTVKKLTSIDVSRSTFPLTENTLENCENLENLRFLKLANEIPANKTFKSAKKLEYVMFHHISGLKLTKDMFFGLDSLKYLFITKCTIENFSQDVFKQLKHLEVLYFTGNSLRTLTGEAFKNLTSLKILGIYDNVTDLPENLNIDYEMFKNFPLLETISFPEENIRKLNFGAFASLKNVQLIVGKSSDDVLEFLKEKNINVEWTSDIDYSKEDITDPNIQICS